MKRKDEELDVLDDIIGCVINDNAMTDQKSERLYYDEDDFGELTKKITEAVDKWLIMKEDFSFSENCIPIPVDEKFITFHKHEERLFVITDKSIQEIVKKEG